MARMPGATWVGPHHDNGLMRAAGPNVIVFHTIVGHDPAHAAHLSIGGYGELSQSRDTAYQSAACKNGNPRAIAVETEDLGPPFPAWNTDNGHDVPAWTDAQLDRAVDCCLFAYRTHGVPLVAAADSKTGSAGVAYHRQGIDGNFAAEGYAYGGRVPDGEVWTDYPGKVCPGDRRIRQLREVVIPRARTAAGLDVTPELQEALMGIRPGDMFFVQPTGSKDVYACTLEGVQQGKEICYARLSNGLEWAIASANKEPLITVSPEALKLAFRIDL